MTLFGGVTFFGEGLALLEKMYLCCGRLWSLLCSGYLSPSFSVNFLLPKRCRTFSYPSITTSAYNIILPVIMIMDWTSESVSPSIKCFLFKSCHGHGGLFTAIKWCEMWKNLDFSQQWHSLLPGSTTYFKKKMAIEESPYGVHEHLDRKLLLSGLLDCMLC